MVGEASFQAPRRFAWCLPFVDLGFVVAATEAGGHADLGDGDGVEDGVELPISVTGQPVTGLLGAGDLDQCRAGVVSETPTRWGSG